MISNSTAEWPSDDILKNHFPATHDKSSTRMPDDIATIRSSRAMQRHSERPSKGLMSTSTLSFSILSNIFQINMVSTVHWDITRRHRSLSILEKTVEKKKLKRRKYEKTQRLYKAAGCLVTYRLATFSWDICFFASHPLPFFCFIQQLESARVVMRFKDTDQQRPEWWSITTWMQVS